jgi:hypothetical protein
LELSLPDAPQFAVVGAELRIDPGAFQPSLNTFVIGNLPKSGSSAAMLALIALPLPVFAYGLGRMLKARLIPSVKLRDLR